MSLIEVIVVPARSVTLYLHTGISRLHYTQMLIL